MSQSKRIEWIKLDNASKIFAATCNDRDTKVFRIACELYEAVNPEILQKALDITIERFPLYKSILRSGLFWYYLETSDIKPIVELDNKPVCAPIYRSDKRGLLFRTSYYKNRINLEVFHALSDGTGALWFMKTLVYYYLLTKHKDDFPDDFPELDYYASISEKMDDSFNRYFPGKDFHSFETGKNKKTTFPKVYRIRGSRLDENRIKVIEGAMSAKAVLDEAHKYNTTLTIFLASLMICSIYEEIPIRSKDNSVVLAVPVNLRQFFKSETSRNFFMSMNIGYAPKSNKADLSDVIKSVSEGFESELTEDKVNQHLNWLISLERNPATRIVPLPLKNYSLRIAYRLGNRESTSSISNVGVISMPHGFEEYIRQITVIPNIMGPKMALCTYKDRLVVSFASHFRETEIQKNFFEYLANQGIEIDVSSNY